MSWQENPSIPNPDYKLKPQPSANIDWNPTNWPVRVEKTVKFMIIAHGGGIAGTYGLKYEDYIRPLPGNTRLCRQVFPLQVLMTHNDTNINLRELFKHNNWVKRFERYMGRDIDWNTYCASTRRNLFRAELADLAQDDVDADDCEHTGINNAENLRHMFDAFTWFNNGNIFDELLDGDEDGAPTHFGIWAYHPVKNKWIQILDSFGGSGTFASTSGISTQQGGDIYNFFCNHVQNSAKKLKSVHLSYMIRVLRTFQSWNNAEFEIYLTNCSPVGEHDRFRRISIERQDDLWKRAKANAYFGADYWAEHFKITKRRVEMFHEGHTNFRTKISATIRKPSKELMNWKRESTSTFSIMDKEERQELYICLAAYLRYFRDNNPDGTARRAYEFFKDVQATLSADKWDQITLKDMCYLLTQITYPSGVIVPKRFQSPAYSWKGLFPESVYGPQPGILEGGSKVRGIAQITRKMANNSGNYIRANLNGQMYIETISRRVFGLIKTEWDAGHRALHQPADVARDALSKGGLLVRNKDTILQPKTCMALLLSIFGGEGPDVSISPEVCSGFPTYLRDLRDAKNNRIAPKTKIAGDYRYWYDKYVFTFKSIINQMCSSSATPMYLGPHPPALLLQGGRKTRKRKRKRKRKKKKTKRKYRKKGTKRSRRRKNRRRHEKTRKH